MSDQTQEKNPLETNPVEDNSASQPVEDDYGLKKLTIYTVFFSISCLVIAGVWYKKDEIPVTAMVDTTIEFYNQSSQSISENYKTVITEFFEPNTVIQGTAIVTDENINNKNQQLIKQVTNEKTKAPVETLTEETFTNDTPIDVADIETEVKSEDIIEDNVLTATDKEIVVDTDKLLVEKENESAAITSTTETVSEVNNAAQTTTVLETNEEETISPVTQTVAVIESTNEIKMDGEVTKTVNAAVVNKPDQPVYKTAPRGYRYGYAPLPYGFNAPVMDTPNNMQRHVGPYNYALAQQQAFENNMRIQKQMMQQAYRMQTVIFKEADNRHQEMLKRVALWKAWQTESQKQFKTVNAPHRASAYPNYFKQR